MKYCVKCGKELADEAVMCPGCGNMIAAITPEIKDEPNFGYALLSFFFPIVGLILWLMWKDKTPLRAKSAGKGAIIGVILSVVFTVVFAVLYLVFIFMLMSNVYY